MTRTINLSNTQFRYQLVFFVYMYGYIWLAEGCLWHLLPRQNLPWHLLYRQNFPSAAFTQAKRARRYVLPGCMIYLIQREIMCDTNLLTNFFRGTKQCSKYVQKPIRHLDWQVLKLGRPNKRLDETLITCHFIDFINGKEILHEIHCRTICQIICLTDFQTNQTEATFSQSLSDGLATFPTLHNAA